MISSRSFASAILQMSELVVYTGVAYNALSFVFVSIPCVSRLQWHPFSITSSPLENSPTLTICIKPLGKWTKELHRKLAASDAGAPTSSCPFSNLVFAEGPYGHSSDFYLRYDALFLVAGGIGITPFIAILRDLYYRYQAKEHGLPKSIQLIWTVKSGAELVLLTDVFPPKRFSHGILHLECHAFLTGCENTGEGSLMDGNDSTINFPNVSGKEGSVSAVAATGNGLWIVLLLAVASSATILVMHIFYLSSTPHSQGNKPNISNYRVALLFLGSMIVGICGFGGIVMLAWTLLRNMEFADTFNCKKTSVYDGNSTPGFPLPDRDNVWKRHLLDNTSVMKGRPNLPSNHLFLHMLW